MTAPAETLAALARFTVSADWRNDGMADLGLCCRGCLWSADEGDLPEASRDPGEGDGSASLDALVTAALAHECAGRP